MRLFSSLYDRVMNRGVQSLQLRQDTTAPVATIDLTETSDQLSTNIDAMTVTFGQNAQNELLTVLIENLEEGRDR